MVLQFIQHRVYFFIPGLAYHMYIDNILKDIGSLPDDTFRKRLFSRKTLPILCSYVMSFYYDYPLSCDNLKFYIVNSTLSTALKTFILLLQSDQQLYSYVQCSFGIGSLMISCYAVSCRHRLNAEISINYKILITTLHCPFNISSRLTFSCLYFNPNTRALNTCRH